MIKKSAIFEAVKNSPRKYWVSYQLNHIEGDSLTHKQFVDILYEVNTECHIYGCDDSWFDLYDLLNQLYWNHFSKSTVLSFDEEAVFF